MHKCLVRIFEKKYLYARPPLRGTSALFWCNKVNHGYMYLWTGRL